MTKSGAFDLALEVIGGYCPNMPAEDLPLGASGNCQDVQFWPVSGGQRPGTVRYFPNPFTGNPTVLYEVAFDNQGTLELLTYDSTGTLRSGSSSIIQAAIGGLQPKSTAVFGREYFSFAYGPLTNTTPGFPADIPRQYDGTYFDRVSQGGPGQAPSVMPYLPMPAAIANPSTSMAVTITALARSVPKSFVIVILGKQQTVTLDTLVTVTAAGHGLTTGDSTQIAGAGTFNGTVVVTVLSSSQFTYAQNGTVGETGSAGTSTYILPSLTRSNNVVTVETATPHGFQQGWYVELLGTTDAPVGGPILNISIVNGLVTVETTTLANLSVGDIITIAGVSNAAFDNSAGVEVTAILGGTNFQYLQPNLTNGSSSGGTISVPWSQSGVTYPILSVPTPQSFTYESLGPDVYASPSGATANIVGQIGPGIHQVTVSFLTRMGYYTQPAPPTTFNAPGGMLAALTQIATGPSNVVGRLVQFTATILPPGPPLSTGPFFSVTKTMLIMDNVTTAGIFDFSDTTIASGLPTDYLADLIVLPPCAGVTSYASSLFWWNPLNYVQNFVNLAFDGGFTLGATGTPLGWTVDATYGAGAGAAPVSLWGGAYAMTCGAGSISGMIEQGCVTDYFADPVLVAGKTYSVRFSFARGSQPLSQLTAIKIDVYSPTSGVIGILAQMPLNTATQTFQWYAGGVSEVTMPNPMPPDSIIRVYLINGNISVAGAQAYIDEIMPFDVSVSTLIDTVYGSMPNLPENYDNVDSVMNIQQSQGQVVRDSKNVRGNLCFALDRRLVSVQQNPNAPPAQWIFTVESGSVGTPSLYGMISGEDWVVIINENGWWLYFSGEPIKINAEIQRSADGNDALPTWENVDWANGFLIWGAFDFNRRWMYIGVPQFAEASACNLIWLLNLENLVDTSLIATSWSVHFSSYTGKILEVGDARKFCPWNLSAAYGAYIPGELMGGTSGILLGNSAGNGLMYYFSDTAYDDDGVAINGFYQTAYFPDLQAEKELQLSSGPKEFAYLALGMRGSGVLNITAYPQGGGNPLTIPPQMLYENPMMDQTLQINLFGERISFLFGLSVPGSWWIMKKFIPSLKQNTWMPVR